MAKEKEVQHVVRIPKAEVNSLSSKGLFYYMNKTRDDEGNEKISYVLVDNKKGKKELSEFDSIKDLEKSLNK